MYPMGWEYRRGMAHYEDLLQEAEEARRIKRITGTSAGWETAFLASCADALIAAGLWIKGYSQRLKEQTYAADYSG